MKRLFLLSIVASLCASGFTSADAFGEYQYSNNGNGTCTITGYTGPGGDITIPDTLGGLTVTSIGFGAFASCTSLTSVVIGNSVTSIGGWAFWGCTSLTSVVIPDSVTSIGDGAFRSCTGLTAITVDTNNPAYSSADGVLFNKSQTTLIHYPAGLSGSYAIPDSVTGIGAYAFAYCTSLTSVIIPDSVTSIGDEAFYSCTRLTSIVIGDSVTSIGDGAFEYCTSLTSVVIGDSVTSIGDFAFEYCTSLTSVVIGNSVTSIGGYAFYSCTSLTGVVIPDSVTSIGGSAFYSCTRLTSVVIGDSVASIGDGAFEYCTSLTGVVIPDSVTSIGAGAFRDCTSLIAITVDTNNPAYSSADGVLFNKSQTTLIQYPTGLSGSYAIPDSVTSIGDYAFYFCTGLTGVVIPDSVTSIGYGAFRGCTSLIAITVDTNNPAYSSADGVLFNKSQTTLIQYSAGLSGSYAIPDSVTGIGDYAFYSCTSLTSVVIPDSVTRIGYGAFRGCTSLIAITVDTNNPAYSSADGVLFNKSQTTLIQYPTGLSGSYAIPDSVTSIGNGAFNSCTSLTSVVIGDGVTSIRDYAFAYCTSLTSVVIPDSVTSIGYYAFAYCTSLTCIFFKGIPPALEMEPFNGCQATVYYVPQNAASWPATFGRRPTALWQLSMADLNEDGNVDFFDFLTFAAAWQTVSGVDAAYNGECDLAEPFGIIDIADLQLLANEWLITPCQSQ